ncbi:MAG TPA: nitrate reductase, partial [Dermatophilaceae bacterium]|nr:nitrate reductase [Dermatophilaceae bacterium]
GMIGLLGAKIWKENGVDFGNPINLVPVAAGIVIGIGDVKMKLTDNFTLSGIALGTIVAILAYHLAKAIAPKADLTPEGAEGTAIAVGDHVYGDSDGIDDLYQGGEHRRGRHS